MSPAEIGRRVGVSDRTVRRYLAALRETEHSTSTPDTSAPVAA
jgi:response regulator of citrate/malate metabolism